MILYPSIHLKEGAVSRFTRAGDPEEAEVLHDDPTVRAQDFERQKFEWLHVVDLDGAFEGRPVNTPAIEAILKSVKIPIQLSGGMRDLKVIEEWLERGVSRIVLASLALRQPDLAREACRLFPGRIAIKIDSRDGYAASTGWLKLSGTKALDLALRFEDAGAAAIVHASINRDGALAEINREALTDFAFALTTPVIASGGITSLADLAALKTHEKSGIAGLILGRALYTGKIDAGEALKLAAA